MYDDYDLSQNLILTSAVALRFDYYSLRVDVLLHHHASVNFGSLRSAQ